MWLPLLWIALTAAPPIDPTTLMNRMEQLRQRTRDESYLLNQQIRLPQLAVWDSGQHEWRSPQGMEGKGPRSTVRIVHLWADYCPPCRTEFPRLKRIVEQLQSEHPRDVQFILVSETRDSEAMSKFMAEYQGRMPGGMQYGDTNLDLMHAVLQALPQSVEVIVRRSQQGQPGMSREAPLPLTLVLDPSDIVRLAFVGSMEGRHGELVSGILQLLRVSKSRSAALPSVAPLPMARASAALATRDLQPVSQVVAEASWIAHSVER